MAIQLSVPACHGIVALALLATAPVAAQATLIKDINTVSSGNLGSRPTFPTYTYQPTFRTPSGLVLFVANRPGVGQELFFTFGVPSATQLLRDINPGPSNSFPSSFIGVGSTTYFYATTGNEGRELWRTDGTFGGTALVKDIVPGPSGSAFGRDSTDFFDHGHGSMAALGSTLYLLLDGALGLYRSDGTAAGTTLVKALTPLPAHKGVDRPNVYLGSPVYTEVERRIVTVGNTLFFGADDGTGSGYELWKSDGTAVGTVRVKDINPGAAGSDPTGFFVHGGKLWFRADDGTNGVEMWTSDGTAAGTTLFKDINLGGVSSLPTQMTAVGSTIYFRANDGSTGEELWLTDGTSAGTRLVADLAGASSFPTGFTPFGNQLLFGASSSGTVTNFDLYITDGVTTTQLRDNPSSYVFQPLVVGNEAFFTGFDTATGKELWKTDGTVAGTVLVHDIWPGSSPAFTADGPHYLTLTVIGLMFFTNDGSRGFEPWVSDGTIPGTMLLADINSVQGTAGSGPTAGIALGRNYFFRGSDGVSGLELWKTDGTAAGTQMVMDIQPGAPSGNPYSFMAVDNFVYFTANDGTGSEMWRSDGTAAGTSKVMDIRPTGEAVSGLNQAIALDGALYFAGDDGVNGYELWRTFGTPGTTTMVADINPFGAAFPTSLNFFASAMGRHIYFRATDGPSGIELWRSDGTAAGTVLVKDINPGGGGSASSSFSHFMTVAGRTLFFWADNGATGMEPWKSDGTTAGTVLLKDIFPGATGSVQFAGYGNPMTAAGNDVYFFADDGVHGYELWKSDGSPAGTVMVKDLNPGPVGALGVPTGITGRPDPFNIEIVAFGNGVLFRGTDGTTGLELWKTDGTAAGTVLVADIEPGPGSSAPTEFRRLGSRHVFFQARNSVHGAELWRTDGTAAGTVVVTDIGPGNNDGCPAEAGGAYWLVGSHIVIPADDGVTGLELWAANAGATAHVVDRVEVIGINAPRAGVPSRNRGGCSLDGFAPDLSGTDPVLGQTFDLRISGADPNSVGVLLLGLAAPALRLGQFCPLWIDLTRPVITTGFATSATGGFLLPGIPVPADISLIGVVIGSQAVVAGPNGFPPHGLAFTSALWLAPGF